MENDEQNKKDELIKQGLNEIEEAANRLTSGNVAHQRGNILNIVRYIKKLFNDKKDGKNE